MKKAHIAVVRILVLVAVGVLGLFAPAEGEETKAAPLAKDEVIIEAAYYEKPAGIKGAQFKEVASCSRRLKENVSSSVTGSCSFGTFMAKGKVTRKADDYVLFKGKAKLVGPRYPVVSKSLTLPKGEEVVIGGLTHPSIRVKGKIIIKADW